MRNLTASMFCVLVGRGSNPKMQAVPTFLVAKGVSKLDSSRAWWGAVPDLGATNFLSHWREVPGSEHGNEQPPNGHQHTHETRAGICLFPCAPVCSAPRLPLGLLQLSLQQRPCCCQSTLVAGPSSSLARQDQQNGLRPRGAELPCLPGSPTYL